MVFAMAGFAIEDAVIKQLSEDLPISQVLMLIGMGGLLAFGLVAQIKSSSLFVSHLINPKFLIRMVCELISAILFVVAIVSASLSASSAIMQATPLAVALGGVVFMKQQVSAAQWAFIIIGFLGVLLIVQPGMKGFQVETLFAVAGVFFLAARDLITRSIAESIEPLLISFWAFFALFLAGLVTVPVFGDFISLNWSHIGLLMISAVAGSCGYFSVVLATRGGDVAAVSPFRYSRLVFALLLSVLFFGETLNLPIIVGSGLVIGSGLFALRFGSK
jgi:drug/metabolite transporter (DMT)-like permease